MKRALIWFSINNPRLTILICLFVTLVFLAVLPSIKTDTDPVKMLNTDNPAVVLYNQMKADFRYNDVIVLGIKQKQGKSLFTVDALSRIHELTNDIIQIQPPQQKDGLWHSLLQTLQWYKSLKPDEAEAKRLIVVEDIISPSTVDNILLNSKGELSVRPLMKVPPVNEHQAQQLLTSIHNNRILKGKLASDDGSLIGVFIPLEKGMKPHSYYIGEKIKALANIHLGEGETYYLAGLPIAETTFGFEMFVQMGIYAPLAGLVIFILMYLFFGNVKLVLGPMFLAMMTVIWAMGGLIYSGNTVHIMSSMIPIFLMPVALLDSIHIISHLHDKIDSAGIKEETIWQVIQALFNPMLFTSITTMVGFISLAVTGIQPVEVFGITIACGVFVAWFLSMTFMPAYIMLLDFETLKASKQRFEITGSVVVFFRELAINSPWRVIVFCLIAGIISLIGVNRIVVNDNPVRWFKADHPLREADSVMNNQLAGTYMTNLIIELPIKKEMDSTLPDATEAEAFEENLFDIDDEQHLTPDLRNGGIIRYIESVQAYLLSINDSNGQQIVGAATSIVDILSKVGNVAFNDPSIPLERDKIAQYMFLYESGDIKRGKDLWKFITHDYQKAQIWLQLKNGDNKTMDLLMNHLDAYIAKKENTLPGVTLSNGDFQPVKLSWTGLTHINNVWQDEMVRGMGYALLGSFVVVFIMMSFLFRSPLWGAISMLPLSMSITFIYGLIGWGGKFYDMPIAVLSSLALGLSIDFAIHFNQSFKEIISKTGDIKAAFWQVFAEPSRAIWRNVLVLTVGFTPLFLASLVPYVTVGAFFFLIMIVSGAASLILLPSLIYILRKWLPGVREFMV